MDVRERVRTLRDASAMRGKAFSRTCGLGDTHIGMFLRGRIGELTRPSLARIASACGTTEVWLAYGHGEGPTDDAVRAALKKASKARTESLATAARPGPQNVRTVPVKREARHAQ